MYALVVDNEFEGFVDSLAVRRAIHTGLHVEVATFNPLRGWVPVCLDKFYDFALAALLFKLDTDLLILLTCCGILLSLTELTD